MKRTSLKQNINELKKISSRFPKTLNEALNFNEMENDDEMILNDEDEEPEMMDEPHHGEMHDEEPGISNASEKAKKLIDDIRKMSLKAMAELADVPQSSEYENLKRIWQLTDKAVNEKEEQREIMHKQNGLN